MDSTFWRRPTLSLLALAICVTAAPSRRDNSVTIGDSTYQSGGLVAFGLIPSDFIESTGDTLGGIGSATTLKPGSWKALDNGTFTGTLVVEPDRGYNVVETIDYQARQHYIDFWLTPYTDSSKLSFEDAQLTLVLSYSHTVLLNERDGKKTTGLDSGSHRNATGGDPVLPTPTSTDRLSLDVEGIVANEDGSFWISDEYGPYIYHFSAEGALISTIAPPDAIIPKSKSGDYDFTSVEDPDTGRASNQGFEGLTIDNENHVLYAMLQTATVQDGGDQKETSRYTRLLGWDISDVSNAVLVGEWVVPLPQSKKGKTRGSNEIAFLRDGIFLSLTRDGNGRGDEDLQASYKQVDLFDISAATDIHGTKYDDPEHSLRKGGDGDLDDGVEPAQYYSFVDMLDEDGLARFGLQNSDDQDDKTHINAKFEGLVLAPTGKGDQYFLFVVSDNDFQTTQGISLGQPFDAGIDVDNQFLVYTVTLPGLTGQIV
ncbi:hypothetical protein CYLTODRAFT_494631 [Cylindrobasidium torrendii FP15055 ss-10]|uniref:Phytase-like domain-containing protein n=1 Tax=Cylindrobasidium torrendii FP15055 ss-10 TaxID=1314674 RepID=A0A0D7AYV9_9AGAR|nr:hypothetical protein CYLTODRAFT_494631 [Cylindrobasidium torrendii FP15055 ss-10]